MTGQDPRHGLDLVGHAAAERALLEAYNSGHLAHAWLICGPRGIGKATLAYRFARFLLTRPPEAGGEEGGGLFGDALPPAETMADSLDVDPEHPAVQRIAARAHADLLVLERRVNERTGRLRDEILVDDVRRVGAFFARTAAEGGWRVVIVDAADEMNRNGANALLKGLEEPPSRAILLLVAHAPGRLLPTIRSRCRKLALNPLGDAELRTLVALRMPDLAAADADLLVDLAEGSVARALALGADGGLEFCRDVLELLDRLPQLDVPALHTLADSLVRPGAESRFQAATDLLRGWLMRRIRRLATAGGQGTPALDPWLEVWDKTETLLARAAGLDLDRKQVILLTVLSLQATVREAGRATAEGS